ncbi:carboxypeptidase-like regulatory domain-containing protein [Aequorivita echinoideorum]|uniref:Carboxypeptidase-like regulatory domain-containing protein n=2 Tax=Aequorivita echinoideorum TaxID=1549647 RepID=A0ABS5S5Y9_9FLAO|nr:carboxypeptidase-like regulatory domain-containing protein [Aequorivita echinoideorum]
MTSDTETTRTHTVIVGKIRSNAPVNENDSHSITIKGTVNDDTGLPLPGANVVIKGTSVGTQTDFDGNYSIEAEPGTILVFSYVGFESKEIVCSSENKQIDVKLEYGGFLGEVVVTGGISFEEETPKKDPNWYEKAKQAYKNTQEFRRIKHERKKAERKAKRSKKQ